MKISALILVKNEQELISDCLSQLNFCQEIIVLDQESTDKTVEIAKKFTNKIYETKNINFDQNRNFLQSLANYEWLLYLDADERLTQESIGEIKNAIKSSEFAAYYFPRKNMILNKWVTHGGWWPDFSPRLFKKSELIGWQGNVHETPKIKGKSGYFKNPLVHQSGRSVSQMFNKSIKWARIESDLYDSASYPKVNQIRVVKAMLIEFFTRFVIKRGFLDGYIGFIEAIYQAIHQAMILTYLWEKRNTKKL